MPGSSLDEGGCGHQRIGIFHLVILVLVFFLMVNWRVPSLVLDVVSSVYSAVFETSVFTCPWWTFFLSFI
jgi:hypothetical protein